MRVLYSTRSAPWHWSHVGSPCEVAARLLWPDEWTVETFERRQWADKVSRCVACGRYINWHEEP